MHEHIVFLSSLNFLGLDSDLSLYVLLILCLMWVAAVRNIPLSWSWPVYVRATLIAASAIIGLTIGPRSFFAVLGWLFFVILYVLPIILFKRLSLAIAELNGKELVNMANWLRLFNWGKQGQFLRDTARALSLILVATRRQLMNF